MENQSLQAANNQLINNDEVSTGDWMLTIFLLMIPIVGIILLFVWAFGGGTKRSKANFAKASLIWLAIIICFYLILGAAVLSFMFM